jgi:trimethylamine--corrinoid protein Co-methyltransferase
LKLLDEAGCLVDYETQMARIPAGMAEECLRAVPSSYEIRARDPKRNVRIGGDRVHFLQGMGMRYVDPDTWELRPATLREHAEVQIVGDALENVHVMDALFSFTDIKDVPGIMQQLEGLANGFRYSSKAQHYGYMKDSDQFAIKMAQALGATLDAEIDVAPPVAFYPEALDAIWRFAELGWCVWASPGGRAGATAPGPLASVQVQSWAGTIAFIVITQLIHKGTPVGLHPCDGVVHTKWAHGMACAPETWYARAMSNQLCRCYGIPVTTAAGFCGAAKEFDYQAGVEKSLGVLSSVMTGSHLHTLHGSFAGELGYSNILQVLDDDIAGSIGRYLLGADIDDETLAVDEQLEMGTAPVSFMGRPLTRRYWARDRFEPVAADWDTHANWVKSGKVGLVSRARARVDAILGEHKPDPLTANQQKLIDDILQEAREYYRANGLLAEDEWAPYVAAVESATLP